MDEKQYAVFCRKGSDVDELIECAASPGMQKTKTAFQVEKVVVLSDAEYAAFRKEGFMQDQTFLFENRYYMWFDPSETCWHCLLIKGEHSREGILVEAEGYSYARYAAHVPDCSLVRVGAVPVQFEYPVKPPHKKKEAPER
ncbi:hypothetical protein Ruko_21460 [Ruthenibacterium sp. TH_2024_36131]|uniref:DUF6329 domain-containing protein n=1 Tax=Owariibacterium komagatae TaxID=3136601 RepID=UPI0038B3FFFC